MASSGMLLRAALVRTDVSVEPSASIFRVTRIGELGRTLALRPLLLTANVVPTESCHADDGGAKFFRNVGSYKSHTS
jgi:hypothetical protein